jgi:hypothetical protein
MAGIAGMVKAMERYLIIFREELTVEQEAVLVRDICAVDVRRELGAPFSFLSNVIELLNDDIDPFAIAIYSMSAINKMSLLELRDWRPLHRLRLTDELIVSINKSNSLVEKLLDVSAYMSELEEALRSYAYQVNEAVGIDAQSFGEIGETLQTDWMAIERERLGVILKAEFAKHRLE